jgi:hypothetical protein
MTLKLSRRGLLMAKLSLGLLATHLLIEIGYTALIDGVPPSVPWWNWAWILWIPVIIDTAWLLFVLALAGFAYYLIVDNIEMTGL